MFVDSHCHLNFPEFAADLEEVIARARQAGVRTLLTVNTKLAEAEILLRLSQKFPRVYCSVGVHPHESKDYLDEHLYSQLINLCQHDKVVGIGETGLDYHYNHSPPEVQQQSFITHLAAAKALNLPVIIHTRQAEEDTLACLKGCPGVRGVFHCFSSQLWLAKAALDLGFYISFSGIITFKNADEVREVVNYVPLEQMLIETDAPFLAPLPYRGKRNEPAFVRYTAEQIAFLKGVPVSEVAAKTTANFFQLFNRAQPEAAR